MQSADNDDKLSTEQRQVLLLVARESIEYGVKERRPLTVDIDDYHVRLRRPGASFVTLKQDGQLRGCIGTLEAYQPLVQDVATHAFDAAFNDRRFPPLQPDECPALDVHLSVLTEPRPLEVANEAELLACLRPGTDGLVLEEGRHRATFLPAVWDQLPEPGTFLQHLKLKAGLPANHWSDAIKLYRYATESFPE
jgi:AmmeMemoRadiSam system protein A